MSTKDDFDKFEPIPSAHKFLDRRDHLQEYGRMRREPYQLVIDGKPCQLDELRTHDLHHKLLAALQPLDWKAEREAYFAEQRYMADERAMLAASLGETPTDSAADPADEASILSTIVDGVMDLIESPTDLAYLSTDTLMQLRAKINEVLYDRERGRR